MKALLAADASARASAQDDTFAIHFAAQKGHVGTTELLINAGTV